MRYVKKKKSKKYLQEKGKFIESIDLLEELHSQQLANLYNLQIVSFRRTGHGGFGEEVIQVRRSPPC